MLSWLPIVGPIIDGIVSIFTKFQDTKLGEYKTDAGVAVAQIQSYNALTLAFIHDIPVRLARDIIMFPGSIWCGLYIEGKIVGKKHPEWVWPVLPLDGPMAYLPIVLMGFFFGSAAVMWLRK